jgi:predicted RNA binding protein YcfA (HicA-like mRNA interferase family)
VTFLTPDVAADACKGSHLHFWNPTTKRIVTLSVHTKKEVGTGLLNRILKDAGINPTKGGKR